MENSIRLLNFDGVYKNQSFYQDTSHEWIDLEEVPNTNLLCERDTLAFISEELSMKGENPIHFLGSGNYHYASYLLQSRIKTPYTLILFDHHTDTLPSPSDELISCGSWVLELLHSQPMLERVYILGVGEDAYEHIPESILNRVVYYTKGMLQNNMKMIMRSIVKNIPTNSVYISIDKDVLDKKDAMTGWDHGTLRMRQLLMMLKVLFRKKQIIGLDVCGELPMNPSDAYEEKAKQSITKNNVANRILLESVKQWTKRKRRTTLSPHTVI